MVDRRRTSSSLRCMILRALAALLGTRDVDLLNNGHYYSPRVLTTVELRTVCSNPGLSHHRSTIHTRNIGRSGPSFLYSHDTPFPSMPPCLVKALCSDPKGSSRCLPAFPKSTMLCACFCPLQSVPLTSILHSITKHVPVRRTASKDPRVRLYKGSSVARHSALPVCLRLSIPWSQSEASLSPL